MAMGHDAALRVHCGTLGGAAGECRDTAHRITARLQHVRAGAVRAADGWDGEAQRAFRRRLADWDRAAADLRTVLQRIAGALDSAGREYAAAERRNTRRWQ